VNARYGHEPGLGFYASGLSGPRRATAGSSAETVARNSTNAAMACSTARNIRAITLVVLWRLRYKLSLRNRKGAYARPNFQTGMPSFVALSARLS
jgi:hypothetical protein